MGLLFSLPGPPDLPLAQSGLWPLHPFSQVWGTWPLSSSSMPGTSSCCRKAWLAYKWTLAPSFSSQGLLRGLSGPALRLEPSSAQSTCALWSWFLISHHNKPGCLPPGSYLTRIPVHLGEEEGSCSYGRGHLWWGGALQTRQVCAVSSPEADCAGRAYGASWPLCQLSVNYESRRCGPWVHGVQGEGGLCLTYVHMIR